MVLEKFVAKIYVILFFVLTIYFLYFGITTTPEILNESDSLTYHIPIATELAKGSFTPPEVAYGFGFYPAAAEVILAIFIFLHLPLNTFCVLGLIILFLVSRKIGKEFGLSPDMSTVFAGVVVTLQSVLRWPLNQTIDIWLTIFFLLTLGIMRKHEYSLSYYLKLGFFGGLLVGSKYSGIFYFLAVLLIYGKKIIKDLSVSKFVVFLGPFFFFGLSWYIRNYVLTGNPFYPANFLFLKGAEGFPSLNNSSWSVLGNVLISPNFLLTTIEALFSEFLGWGLALALMLYNLLQVNQSKDVFKLSFTSFLVLFIFVTMLPATPIVSNMRYIYPAIAMLILTAFLQFKRYPQELLVFALINTVFSLINLNYYPKLLLLGFIPAYYFLQIAKLKHPWRLQRKI